jgi:endonuclease YncB( thermonuclease family)
MSVLLFCGKAVEKDILFLPDDVEVLVMDKSKIELDDGDSFTYDSTGIRVLGMDTPEITHTEHGFFEDQPFGREAADLTASIIEQAKEISYVPVSEDRYGRTLAHVFIDGNLLSIRLISAGLAYETVTHYGDNGFPGLAERILKAAEESQVKDFIPPYQWRRENRKDPQPPEEKTEN